MKLVDAVPCHAAGFVFQEPNRPGVVFTASVTDGDPKRLRATYSDFASAAHAQVVEVVILTGPAYRKLVRLAKGVTS